MERSASDYDEQGSSAEVVSDSYFPPDVDEAVQQLESQQQQQLQERERSDALAHARARFSTGSRWGGVEAYIYSDDAVHDLRHVPWLPIPSAASRRRRWRLMNCMHELQAPAPVTIMDVVSSKPSVTTDSASEAASTSAESTPPAASPTEPAGTAGAAASTVDSHGAAELLPHPAVHLTHSSTAGQFSAECWQLVEEVSAAVESEHWTLYTAAATLTLLQRQAQWWAASWLLWTAQRAGMNATRVLASVSAALPSDVNSSASLRGASQEEASASLPPVWVGCLCTVRLVPLAVLALARRAARLATRGAVLLMGGGAAPVHPATDSMMGALATNAVWRIEVEVMLVGTALVVLAVCALVFVRYRKYTRTVELWEAEMVQRYAADVARWDAHVQARRSGARTPTTPSSIVYSEPARGSLGSGVGISGGSGSRGKQQPSPPQSRPASSRGGSLADMLRGATGSTPQAAPGDVSLPYLEESKTPNEADRTADGAADAAPAASQHRLQSLGESLRSGGDDSVMQQQLSGEQLPMQGSFRGGGAMGLHRGSASSSTVGSAPPAARPRTFLVSSTTSAPTGLHGGVRSSSEGCATHAAAPVRAVEVREKEEGSAVDDEQLRRLASPLAPAETRALPPHDSLSSRAFSWMDTVPLQLPGLGARDGAHATVAPPSSAAPRNGRSTARQRTASPIAERPSPSLFSVSAFVGHGRGGSGSGSGGAAASLPRPGVIAAAGAAQGSASLPTVMNATSASDVSELERSGAVPSDADNSDTAEAPLRRAHNRTFRPYARRTTGQFDTGDHAGTRTFRGDALVSLMHNNDECDDSLEREATSSRAS